MRVTIRDKKVPLNRYRYVCRSFGSHHCRRFLPRISAVSRKIERGEGGIRTLGTLLGYGALAKRCFRPLSHLTNKLAEYGEEIPIANLDILGRASAVGKADSLPSEASSFAAVQRNRFSQLPITDCQMK